MHISDRILSRNAPVFQRNALAVVLGVIVLSLVMFSAIWLAGRSEDQDRPNILIILTDDQGWADIGYNNPNVYTPNLDELAAGGARFAQHYVMPQCTPTRVALMTGKYPGRFGPNAQ